MKTIKEWVEEFPPKFKSLPIDGKPLTLLMVAMKDEQYFLNRLMRVPTPAAYDDFMTLTFQIRASERRVEDIMLKMAEFGVSVDDMHSMASRDFDFSPFIKEF